MTKIRRPSRQRLGNLLHQEKICRTGQYEPAGLPSTIDGSLDRQQHLRGTLHFIDGQAIGSADEVIGRGYSLIKDVQVVERQIGSFVDWIEITHQRALAGLARPVTTTTGMVSAARARAAETCRGRIAMP